MVGDAEVTYVEPRRWRTVILLYVVVGFAMGFAPLQETFIRFGIRPGFANAILVNLLMPAAATGIAVWYPRVVAAWGGAFLLVASFVVGRMMYQAPRFWGWDFATLAHYTSPILLAAAVGCGVVGTLTWVVARNVRRVGVAPAENCCPMCGYHLVGLAHGCCPECGDKRSTPTKHPIG